MDELLRLTARMAASDIHLKADSPPVLRIRGDLVPQTQYGPLTADDTWRLYEEITTPARRQRFEREPELDLSYELAGVARYRVNVARQRSTVSIVARRLSVAIPNIEDLRLPSVCKELVMRPRGLVLVTGPTGSGKSTTLASMIDYLNERATRRIAAARDQHTRGAVRIRTRDGAHVPQVVPPAVGALQRTPPSGHANREGSDGAIETDGRGMILASGLPGLSPAVGVPCQNTGQIAAIE